MDFLGKVEEITCDGRLIARCSSVPELGDHVFDRRQNKIGTIGKVFGPVDEPYVSVNVPKTNEMPVPKGTDLFYNKGRNQNGKGKGRNRRN